MRNIRYVTGLLLGACLLLLVVGLEVSADAVINTTTGVISIMPSGDSDDYFTFKTTSGEPTLSVEGGTYLFMDKALRIKASGSDHGRILSSASGTGIAGYYADASDGDFSGNDYLYLRQNDDLTCDLACKGNKLDVEAAGSIYLYANGDTSDYIRFETVSNLPYMFSEGANLGICGSGRDNCIMYQEDLNIPTLATQSMEAMTLLPARFLYVKTEGDTDDYFRFATPGNTPYLGAVGTSVIYFRDGGAFETLHADAYVEHTSSYEGSIDDASRDLGDWIEAKHPEGFYPEHYETKGYVENDLSSTTNVYDEIVLSPGTDLGKAGKALAKLLLNSKERIDVLDSKVASIGVGQTPLESKVPQSTDSSQIDDLTTRISGLESSVSSSSKDCQDNTDKIRKLEDIIDDLEDEIYDLKRDIRDLEDESKKESTTTTLESTTTTLEVVSTSSTVLVEAPASSTYTS